MRAINKACSLWAFHIVRVVSLWNINIRPAALLVGSLLAFAPVGSHAQFLPGLTITGENWTYAEAGQTTVTGILIKPSGSGPFPAVIISHGRGGTLSGFTRPKALEMASWGLVCIGARYTHATDDPDFANTALDGSRPENLRRAEVCYKILQALSEVRGNRISLYGNSMGAFVTIGLAGRHPGKFRAAAITAGGIIPSGEAAAPTVAEAFPIRTPFCMLHGLDDSTVPPVRSELLRDTLNANNVPNERVTWPSVGHDLHADKATEVYTYIRNWFTTHGVFSNESVRFPDRPYGIYVLDSAQGTPYNGSTLRDANIRTYPFLSGYTLRAEWTTMEPSANVYDFTIIENILTKLPAGQKLSLILVPFEPSYIAATAGVTTWTDEDRFGVPLSRAVPWDPYLRERRRAFVEAMASHVTSGTALRDNPILDVIDPYLAGGFTGIRDPNTVPLRNLPGYSRTKLIDAVRDEVRILTSQFPNKFIQLGFWKVTDTQSGTTAWEELRQTLLADFNGILRPRVGFFMENLAASRPTAGGSPVTGYPVTEFAAPLYLSRANTWNAFQALTSWKAPFTGPDKVANASPADGIQYAYDTYGARYVELYVNDLDHGPWQADLQLWSTILSSFNSSVADWERY